MNSFNSVKVNSMKKKNVVAVLALGLGLAGFSAVNVQAQTTALVPVEAISGLTKLVESGRVKVLTDAYGLSGSASVVASELANLLNEQALGTGAKADLANDVVARVINPAVEGKLGTDAFAKAKVEALAKKVSAVRAAEAKNVTSVAKVDASANRLAVGQKAAVSPGALASDYMRTGLIDEARFASFVANTENAPAALYLGNKGLKCPTEWSGTDTKLALLDTVEDAGREISAELGRGVSEREVKGKVCGILGRSLGKVVGVDAVSAASRVKTLAGPECELFTSACAN